MSEEYFVKNLQDCVYRQIESVTLLAEGMFTDRAVKALPPDKAKSFMFNIGRAYSALVLAYEGITDGIVLDTCVCTDPVSGAGDNVTDSGTGAVPGSIGPDGAEVCQGDTSGRRSDGVQ